MKFLFCPSFFFSDLKLDNILLDAEGHCKIAEYVKVSCCYYCLYSMQIFDICSIFIIEITFTLSLYSGENQFVL